MKTRFKGSLILLAFVLFAGGAVTVSAQPSSGEPKYAKLDKARVYYENYGKGKEAIVLIHGWGCNLNHWKEQIPDFSKRARVLAIDLPGHGKSDKPEQAYTMDLFAMAIDAVMTDAKVEKAVLIGHSMGTPVVRQFYRKYPNKTLAIVIVDGSLRPFGDKATRDNFIAAFKSPNYKQAGSQMFAAMSGPNLSDENKEQVKASFLSTPQPVLVSAMESMNDDSLYGPDKINVPVMAILARSPYWTADTEQFFQSIAPGIEVHWFEGVGHFLMMEKPKEFDETVLAFLDKNKLLK